MTPASDSERPFRFFDNRERYLLFTTTTTEKQETAKRICQELTHLDPKPPAFRLFQAGAGEGTLLNLVLRHLHSGWPDTPVLAVVKEISPQFIRMAVRNLADRFREHPELVLVFTNLRYDEAPRLTPRDAGRLRWRDLALTGTTAHGFESQIQAEMVRLNEDWRFREDPGSGTWSYLEPAVLVVHRADQAFVLDRVIPRQDARDLDYDLVIASQPYRAGLPAATKVRRVLAPLACALARQHRIEQETLIGTVEHQHRGFQIERVAGLLAAAHPPEVGDGRGQGFDPPVEILGGTALQRHLLPGQRGRLLRRAGSQPRRFRIVHVGDRHDRARMLGQAVGQLFQGQAQVLDRDLLADHQERYGRKVLVQMAQHAGQDRAVAHAGIEKPQGRWPRREVRKLLADPLGDGPFLAAGRDEQQVFFPVVEEPEGRAAIGRGVLGCHANSPRRPGG